MHESSAHYESPQRERQLWADGIQIGDTGCSWQDLRLTLVQATALAFYRNSRFIPWRTIQLKKVPNARVLHQLVLEHSKRVEVDAGLPAMFSDRS